MCHFFFVVPMLGCLNDILLTSFVFLVFIILVVRVISNFYGYFGCLCLTDILPTSFLFRNLLPCNKSHHKQLCGFWLVVSLVFSSLIHCPRI